jgi:nitroreductase
MELYDAMSTLRAVRRLKPDPIPEETLIRVFTAATWAPSGGNQQGWRIVAVSDATSRTALQELYRPLWDNYVQLAEQRLQGMPTDVIEKTRKALAAGTYLSQHLHEVPVIAVFCFNPEYMSITDAGLDRPSVVGGGSVYPAVQNLLLACRNEGLGCVLTTLLCIEEAAVKELLQIPDNWHTCAHIPIGYPVGSGHGPISRNSMDQMVSWDRFEQ